MMDSKPQSSPSHDLITQMYGESVPSGISKNIRKQLANESVKGTTVVETFHQTKLSP